jgi:hypothetical protein
MKKLSNFICVLALTFFFISCKENEDQVEFYLLKNRVASTEGIPVQQYAKLKKIENFQSVINCSFDTVKKQLIYGGKFVVNLKDIQKEPLITNDEILNLDLEKSELILSNSARKKISQIKPSMKYGVQFVILVNKKPCLTGYFRSNISSYIYNWNYISYDYYNNNIEANRDENFVIRQNADYEKWKPILTNLKNYPELIVAMKNSNRLK